MEQPTAMEVIFSRMASHAEHSKPTLLTMEELLESKETESSSKKKEENLLFSFPHAPISKHPQETDFLARETESPLRVTRETLAATTTSRKLCAIDPQEIYL